MKNLMGILVGSLLIGLTVPAFAVESVATSGAVQVDQGTAVDAVEAPAVDANGKPVLAAKVVWVKGAFKDIDTTKKIRPLGAADPIFVHDTLQTDDKTKAQIVFTDDTLMTFRPGTEFFVSSYRYDKDGKESGSYIMNLLKGGFRTITGLIAKADPKTYKVVTPVATIGVRGTDYAVYLKDGEVFVARISGKPCVTSKKHGETTLCLDDQTKYAKVGADGVVVPLSEVPDGFLQMDVINKVTFIGGGLIGGGGLIDNFCIQ